METKFIVDRLNELLLLARDASSGFERASVFAAIQCIKNEIDAQALDDSLPPAFNGYDLEKVTQLVSHVYSMIGYSESDGHSFDQHFTWAVTALNSLESSLAKRE